MGRLPQHQALKLGKRSCDGVGDLLRLNPAAVQVQDSETKMPPALLAAQFSDLEPGLLRVFSRVYFALEAEIEAVHRLPCF